MKYIRGRAGRHRATILALAFVAIVGARASAASAAAGLTVYPLTIAFGNVVFGVTGATGAAHTMTISDPATGRSDLQPEHSTDRHESRRFSNFEQHLRLDVRSGNPLHTMKVTFTPTALGARGAQLAISDSASSNAASVTLGGTGIAGKLTIAPLTLSFGNTIVGANSAAKTTTLRNPNTVALHIDSAAPSGRLQHRRRRMQR